MGRLEPEFANEPHLPAALSVGKQLLLVEGVDLLILVSLDHTVSCRSSGGPGRLLTPSDGAEGREHIRLHDNKPFRVGHNSCV